MPAPEKIAERLPDREDLARRMDALTEELAANRDRLQEVSTQLGRGATRRGRGALDASRAAVGQARGAMARLPAPDALLARARRTGQRLLPWAEEPAPSARPWGRWLAAGAGLAALGVLAMAVLRRLRGTEAESEPVGALSEAEEVEEVGEEAEAPAAAETAGDAGAPAPARQPAADDGQVGPDEQLASDLPTRGQQP